MTKPVALASSILALCFGLSLVPAAQAAESGGAMHKTGDAMMHKEGMKKHKKSKDSMMHGDAMQHEDAAPHQ